MFESILSVAGPLISGMMGADAAEDAANTQAQSTRESIAEQRRQFDLNRSDLAPYRGAGGAAVSRLRDLLGLGGAGAGGSGGARTLEDIAGELRSSGRFGSSMPASGIGSPIRRGRFDLSQSIYADDADFSGSSGTESVQGYINQLGRVPTKEEFLAAHYGSTPTSGGVDEAALMAEAQRMYDAQGPSAASQSTPGQLSPGSVLSRRFSADDLANDLTYNSSGIVKAASGIDPAALTRKFTVADFYDDPVVKLGMQFGLDEGRKGIDRGAGAAGLRNSGQTLKALTRFGTDYAGGMAEGSNNRYLGERQNLRDLLGYKDVMTAGAEDRFTGNQDRTYNQLAGLSGVGQNATNQGAALGTQLSGNIANLISAGGNATAASKIAGGNAWGNAFSTIGNWWGQKQMIDKLSQRGASSWGSGRPAYDGYSFDGSNAYG